MRIEAGDDFAVYCTGSSVSRQHHEVKRWQAGSPLTKTLSHEAAKPVTANSQANLLPGNGESQSRPVDVIRMEQDREKPIPGSPAMLKHVIKVRCAQQAQVSWEGPAARYDRSARQEINRNRPSDRESRPALCAAAFQHQAPAASGHAGSETVGPDTLELAGLISSFHEEIRRKTKGWDAREGGRLRSCPAPVNSFEACG